MEYTVPTAAIDPRTRILLDVVRRALIMILGGLEDYMGIQRTITPRGG